MKEISADAWTIDGDVLAITTNGNLSGRRNPMGAGIAGEAAKRYPEHGGLDWQTQVKPLLAHLDDRFTVVSYPGEAW